MLYEIENHQIQCIFSTSQNSFELVFSELYFQKILDKFQTVIFDYTFTLSSTES